jgi:hypothetical protein
MKTLTGLLTIAIIGGGLMASLPANAATYFRDNDRVILHDYVTTSTTTTTTDANGNTTTTYYEPGTVLPDTVTYTMLPTTVTTKLVKPPRGYEYVIIGGNAYLIDSKKRVVIDAEKLND